MSKFCCQCFTSGNCGISICQVKENLELIAKIMAVTKNCTDGVKVTIPELDSILFCRNGEYLQNLWGVALQKAKKLLANGLSKEEFAKNLPVTG